MLDRITGHVLLHLIRSQKMNIFDIPIARLTAQYLEILEGQSEMDLDVAGDYLVMASTLMQLKSRMLLPRPELDEEGNAIDPRQELVAQLIAYEQYRLLAEQLDERPRIGRDVFLRPIFPEAEEVERPLPEADLDALLTAFRAIEGSRARRRIRLCPRSRKVGTTPLGTRSTKAMRMAPRISGALANSSAQEDVPLG